MHALRRRAAERMEFMLVHMSYIGLGKCNHNKDFCLDIPKAINQQTQSQ
jgi:hypothetical protein